MAHGKHVSFDPEDVQKAIDFLFERDHIVFLHLLNGDINIEDFGPVFVPLVFYSQVPDVLIPDEFPMRRRQAVSNSFSNFIPRVSYQLSSIASRLKWTIFNRFPLPRDHVSTGTLPGDVAERKVFSALSEYFNQTKDASLIIHSHSFLYDQNFKEKDFIILNLTKGYVMVIEVKATYKSSYFAKAKEQLRDSKERMQAVFNSVANMSNDWLHVGLCYMDAGDCGSTSDFVINGIRQLDFHRIESKIVQTRTTHWDPDQHIVEFVSVAKVLLFEAQGHPQAPLTRELQIKKIDDELDDASAPENILFWTPEQLSIVQAMDINFMLLMGYYGCGKTVLLIERAEYLLRQNKGQRIHIYIDYEESGLAETLKLRFNEDKRIRIQTVQFMFDDTSNFDLVNDGVKAKDHVIIDEAGMWKKSDEFLLNLQKFKRQVSSLWVALGFVNTTNDFDEEDFRRRLSKINFYCPTLKHCLRNGKKIVELSKSVETKGYLNCFAKQVELNCKTNVNDGLLHEMPLIHENQVQALKAALGYHRLKSFIFMDSRGLIDFQFHHLGQAIPDHCFLNFNTKGAWSKWLNSSETNLHLVVCHNTGLANVSGMEFQSMVYLFPVCLQCGKEVKNSLFISRAKAALVLARYAMQNCGSCISRGVSHNSKTIVWNDTATKWEMKPGVSQSELSPEDVKLINLSSELSKKLHK